MLTTETVSGIDRINKIAKEAVKRFPQYTHQEIAEVLVRVYGETLEQKRTEIKTARDAGVKLGVAQKAKGLASLEKYDLIVQAIADLFKATETTAPVAKPVKVKGAKKAASITKPIAVAPTEESAAITRLEAKFLPKAA